MSAPEARGPQKEDTLTTVRHLQDRVLHDLSRAHLLNAVDDHLVAFLHARVHHHVGATVRAGLNAPLLDLVLGINDEDVVSRLVDLQRRLRDHQARRKEGGELSKIEIRLRLSNGQEYPHRGTWNFTDPQVDQGTDTLIMRATMPNPERMLADGQFVTAIIRERQEAPRLVIPQTALQVDQSGYYVLIVNAEHKIEQRRVQTGPNRGTDVVVNSGVKEGDKVIVDGIQKVRPGQVVQETVLSEAGG